MSVYQVEEYYIYIDVPHDKVEHIKDFLDNHEEMVDLDVDWNGTELTIDNFDCESRANQINQDIAEELE